MNEIQNSLREEVKKSIDNLTRQAYNRGKSDGLDVARKFIDWAEGKTDGEKMDIDTLIKWMKTEFNTHKGGK